MLIINKPSKAPPGKYTAVLHAITPVTGRYGPSLQFAFRVGDGPHAGKELTQTTGTESRPEYGLGHLLRQLYGRELAPDEALDPEQELVGKTFEITASPGDNGAGVIVAIKPIA